MSLLVVVLSVQVYVFLKSWNDSVYILQKKTVPTHGIEWLQVAVVATIGAAGYTRNLWGIAAIDAFQTALTWILMDLELNAFLGHNWITYIGSGWWDEFFKMHYPNRTASAMWAVKLAFLIITVALFLYVKWHFKLTQ